MKSVVIQQTLHGYAEGHRLLDGSVKLSDDLARMMLRMSDLSGSNVVNGFEEYVTGYPLESVDMYALAKTWYAPEMPRPGCVWTHTLLISGDGMREISSFGALATLFVRPESSLTQNRYSRPIEVEMSEIAQGTNPQSNSLPSQILEIVEALYGRDKENVLIGAQTSRGYESAIFHVWSQQWPQLRKGFSFCTGALSARGFAGKPFDIQCTHPSLIREITTATLAKQSREISLLVATEGKHVSWVGRVARDALKGSGEQFRQLLWGLADEPDRKSFAKFAIIIDNLLSESPHSLTHLVGKVAELFPSPDSGNVLKTALFGGKKGMKGFDGFDEGDLLAVLASTEHPEAFSAAGLRLRERGRDLCGIAPQSARDTISKLFRSSINQLGEHVLAGMIEGINPVIAREIAAEQPQFLPTLFRAKPELGTSDDLWAAAGDRRRELVESLAAHEKLDDALIMGIAEAIMESGSDAFIGRALDRWGKAAVFGTLDWVAKHDGKMSELCYRALTFHVESVMDWVEAAPNRPLNAVVASAHVIAPYFYKIRQRDTEIWLRVLHDLQKHHVEREVVYLSAFLIALAFKNSPPAPLTLISECFERVHNAAWDGDLPDDAWVILDLIVPHLWWGNDWDKCERLRRGLIEAFVLHRWPAMALVRCIPNQELLKRVVKSASKVDGGIEALKDIS
jgi:hypothetical protein